MWCISEFKGKGMLECRLLSQSVEGHIRNQKRYVRKGENKNIRFLEILCTELFRGIKVTVLETTDIKVATSKCPEPTSRHRSSLGLLFPLQALEEMFQTWSQVITLCYRNARNANAFCLTQLFLFQS